jgi:hypothetical protein
VQPLEKALDQHSSVRSPSPTPPSCSLIHKSSFPPPLIQQQTRDRGARMHALGKAALPPLIPPGDLTPLPARRCTPLPGVRRGRRGTGSGRCARQLGCAGHTEIQPNLALWRIASLSSEDGARRWWSPSSARRALTLPLLRRPSLLGPIRSVPVALLFHFGVHSSFIPFPLASFFFLSLLFLIPRWLLNTQTNQRRI